MPKLQSRHKHIIRILEMYPKPSGIAFLQNSTGYTKEDTETIINDLLELGLVKQEGKKYKSTERA